MDTQILATLLNCGSFGLFLSLYNRLIKSEQKSLELEKRLDSKARDDKALENKVDEIQKLITEVATIVKQKMI